MLSTFERDEPRRRAAVAAVVLMSFDGLGSEGDTTIRMSGSDEAPKTVSDAHYTTPTPTTATNPWVGAHAIGLR